jgi:type I restriction enzyme S subunit
LDWLRHADHDPDSGGADSMRECGEQDVKTTEMDWSHCSSRRDNLPYTFLERTADDAVRNITDELPFEIPESWEWARLARITTIIGDGIHGTPTYDNNGEYYFINGNNLDLSTYSIKLTPSTKRVSQAEYMKHGKELNNQTVLLSINGTIGNVSFYNGEKVVLGKSAAYINLLHEIEKEYIAVFFQTNTAFEYYEAKHTGTTIKNLSLQAIRECYVPIPPLSEQVRIIECISELLPHIADYATAEQKLTTLNAAFPDALKKSILQAAVQGKLVEQDPTDEPASALLERIRAEKKSLISAGKIKPSKHESVIFRRDNSHYRYCRRFLSGRGK